ncbi:MAG: hypothetical protein ACKOSS_04575 [Planctomycetia bacterium]
MTRKHLLAAGMVLAVLALAGVLWAARARRQARVPAGTPPQASAAGKQAADAGGPWPVTWTNPTWLTLPSADACEEMWRTWRPEEPVTLTFGDDRKLDAHTCAEWAAACDAGAHAHTTYDLSMESFFVGAAAVLCTVHAMTPSTRSAFAGRPLAAYALELTEAGREAASRRLVEPGSHDTLQLEVKGGDIVLRDEESGTLEKRSVRARGDLNGDGWEDLAVDTADYAIGGTYRSYGVDVFTQAGSRRIVDISHQLTLRMLTPAQQAARRQEIARSFGLPEGVEITLHGSVEDGDGRSPVTLRMRVLDGFVEGTSTSHRTGGVVPMAGALGFGGKLDARIFERGPVATATWDLTWTRTGSRLVAKGWFLTHTMELDNVQLAGELPQ